MTAAHTMQCMEVWGGARAADNGVVMPGVDAWVYARPYRGDDEGGDVHYLSSCATGRIVRVLLADVSGHGRDVAELAARLRDMMRRSMNHVDQRRLVSAINREFTDASSEGRFATAAVITCWTPTDDVAITSAGHPPPLRYRSRDGSWDRVDPAPSSGDPRNLPLGITRADYDERRFRMAPGDLLLVYSDAAMEVKREDGTMLGVEGLLDVVRGLDAADPRAMIAELVGRLSPDRTDLDDDLTLMAIRPNALKPRGSLATGLRAGARVAADAVRNLIPGRAAMPEIGLRNIGGAFFDRLNR